jgi:hypothetical protein
MMSFMLVYVSIRGGVWEVLECTPLAMAHVLIHSHAQNAERTAQLVKGTQLAFEECRCDPDDLPGK